MYILKYSIFVFLQFANLSGSFLNEYLYIQFIFDSPRFTNNKLCKTGANVSVPMCLGPPSRGQKAPLRIHKSCLLHMSSRTQHTGGIHKAVSCICNSNIQGCSTLGDPHPVLTVPSFPPPLTTENSLKNPCNVICTNK